MEDPERFYALDAYNHKLKNLAEAELYSAVIKADPKNVLEVGCGDGHFLSQLGNIGVCGMDFNPSMVALAKKRGVQVEVGDVTVKSDLEKIMIEPVDAVVANYVFSEFRKESLIAAFKNIYQNLIPEGHLIFTLTNPIERYRMEFPGYRLIFEEEYDYEKEDIPFIVELKGKDGDYYDVGIRDFHQPIHVYGDALFQSGFKQVESRFIYGELDYAFAVLYDAIK